MVWCRSSGTATNGEDYTIGRMSTVRCQYLLKNVKFNNSYENAPYFSNTQKRNEKIIDDDFNDVFINFNFGNILTTNCIVNTYNGENYIIIKHGENLYFYFIIFAKYISANQWNLTLECDVISQYCVGLAENQSVAKCYIERAHCDRFRRVDSNNLIFDVRNDSPVIENEINFEKITKQRNEVKIQYSSNTALNTWLQNNIVGWQYMYIDSKHPYTLTGSTAGDVAVPYPRNFEKIYRKRQFKVAGSLFTDEYTLCCAPIYKNNDNNIFIIDNINNIYTKIDGLDWFREQNNDNSYIYNIKYSISPPFNFDDYCHSFYIKNGSLFFERYCTENTKINLYTYFDFIDFDVDSFGSVDVKYIDNQKYLFRMHSLFTNLNYVSTKCEQVVTNRKFIFNKNELKGNRSIDFEPKILVDCKTITLRDSSNGVYVYPSLYVGSNTIQPFYNESMSINNNNYYFFFLNY